jgi:hypothetical protein
MGLWKPPATIRLPSEYEIAPTTFAYNGHMPNGTQLLAYTVRDPHNWREPDQSGQGWYRWIVVVHLFDADGRHLSSQQRITGGPLTDQAVADNAGQVLLPRLER